ncbi:hypothetical protein EI94DRAFT_1700067 [Lactarius quietus]|nr:hypothetical protein EI94DRAFT_1700067 [Lactarius quietus]
MTDCATLPLEALDNKSVFRERMWNIGRAYRNQAMELISICQLISRIAPPKLAHEDRELTRIRQVCDLAMRSAADSGTKVTDEANARFKEAIQMLSTHSAISDRLDLPRSVYSKMEIAKRKDSIERDWSHAKADECAPTMIINFVILQSPLLFPHDPGTISVSQELTGSPSLPEILWNFSRYRDRARITLEQNPHFYLRCPADEGAYTPMFRRHPLRDPSGSLEHNDTVYVLFDRPCRVFVDTEHESRIFGNIWLLNGSLVFRDNSGVLEGERLVRSTSIRGKLWYCEQPAIHHESESLSRLKRRFLRPIATTTLNDSPTRVALEDWTVLSRPASHPINIHIYGSRGSPGSTSDLDLPPPSPTSERPGYRVLYTTIDTLEDDILLGIFNYCRLNDKNSWNVRLVRLGWHTLSHVSRRWRHLVYSSAFHLGMHIICTNGTPIVDMLDHLPPLPLLINYRFSILKDLQDELGIYHRTPIMDIQDHLLSPSFTVIHRYIDPTKGMQDELGMYHALLLRDRVRSIVLCLPPLFLHKFLMLMNEPFPILEHLSLSFTVDEVTPDPVLPQTFLSPNLRHLTLLGVSLPKGLSLLSSTVSLVTLALTNIIASGYFCPRQLVARLRFLPQLEGLSIGFSIPIPRPSAEGALLGEQGAPVPLANLKTLKFKGVSTYLEHLVAQIRAPLLERLDITFFGQIAFALPHLSHFISIIEGLKLPTANVSFGSDRVLIVTDHPSTQQSNQGVCFILCVMCKPFDWQIDCAAQICSELIPTLSVVEKLSLGYGLVMPTEWQSGEIDGTTRHDLLRSFIGVKQLRISNSLSEELSRALQVDEIGSDPGFLPALQELVSLFNGLHESSLFGSFIHARWEAGRPFRLSFPRSRLTRRLNPAPVPLFGRSGEELNDQDPLVHTQDS